MKPPAAPRQVSIARALLKDPTLILCDEVTSSVDAFAERDIVDTLRQVRGRRGAPLPWPRP